MIHSLPSHKPSRKPLRKALTTQWSLLEHFLRFLGWLLFSMFSLNIVYLLFKSSGIIGHLLMCCCRRTAMARYKPWTVLGWTVWNFSLSLRFKCLQNLQRRLILFFSGSSKNGSIISLLIRQCTGFILVTSALLWILKEVTELPDLVVLVFISKRVFFFCFGR